MLRLHLRPTILISCETLLIVCAIGLAAYVRLGEWTWAVLGNAEGLRRMLLVAGVTQVCFYYAELYDLQLLADRRELFIRLLQALGAVSFILAAIYFWYPPLIIGRGVFAIAAVLVVTLVVGWRLSFEIVSRQVKPRERLLVVGTNAPAVTLAREIVERRHELGVEIIGFIDPDPGLAEPSLSSASVIGTIEDIPSIVRARGVSRVVSTLR